MTPLHHEASLLAERFTGERLDRIEFEKADAAQRRGTARSFLDVDRAQYRAPSDYSRTFGANLRVKVKLENDRADSTSRI